MKRTLIVATTSYAGMGPYVACIINNFIPKDDVHFFFCEYKESFFKLNIKKELHSHSTFFSAPNSKWNKIRKVLPIKKSYHDEVVGICKDKDIQVVHFINGVGDKCLVKSLSLMNIACVSTVHDLHPHECRKQWYKELYTRLVYKEQIANLEIARNIITNSMFQYEEISQMYSNMKFFYHDFPSLVSHKIASGDIKVSELANLNKPYILFFGRIEEYKGLSLLYEAFLSDEDLNNNYYLVIAGAGKLPFSSNINKENVILINRYINDEEVSSLYQNASCVVYPYISATQTGVLSLAFYFKVPVLCSDIPFFKDIISRSRAGLLFKSKNKTDLICKLKELLNNDNNMFVENGLKFYYKAYDGKAICEKLKRIYDDCVLY